VSGRQGDGRQCALSGLRTVSVGDEEQQFECRNTLGRARSSDKGVRERKRRGRKDDGRARPGVTLRIRIRKTEIAGRLRRVVLPRTKTDKQVGTTTPTARRHETPGCENVQANLSPAVSVAGAGLRSDPSAASILSVRVSDSGRPPTGRPQRRPIT